MLFAEALILLSTYALFAAAASADAGSLSNQDGTYNVSWVADTENITFTIVVRAIFGPTVFIGFSQMRDMAKADYKLVQRTMDVNNPLEQDGFTSGSLTLTLDDTINFDATLAIEDQNDDISTIVLKLPITSPDTDNDVDLSQCVDVIWGYDLNPGRISEPSLINNADAVGFFDKQLCVRECPTKGTSICDQNILKLACQAIKLNSPSSIPKPCL